MYANRLFFYRSVTHSVRTDLFEQEGRGSEGEGPAIVVVEELFGLSGPVHHLIINTGDVEHQADHQTEACTQHINNDRVREIKRVRCTDKREQGGHYITIQTAAPMWRGFKKQDQEREREMGCKVTITTN